jgi:hypothetical protein
VVDYASNIWGHACGSAVVPVLNRVQKNRSTAATQPATQPATNPEDDRRKMSLEKNRLAAAKCRVNKKEKTDHPQRDSHNKAVENTFLKQMIMQMKEEVLQLQTILTSHSSSDRCRNPDTIHEALGAAGSDSFATQMANNHFLSNVVIVSAERCSYVS